MTVIKLSGLHRPADRRWPAEFRNFDTHTACHDQRIDDEVAGLSVGACHHDSTKPLRAVIKDLPNKFVGCTRVLARVIIRPCPFNVVCGVNICLRDDRFVAEQTSCSLEPPCDFETPPAVPVPSETADGIWLFPCGCLNEEGGKVFSRRVSRKSSGGLSVLDVVVQRDKTAK